MQTISINQGTTHATFTELPDLSGLTAGTQQLQRLFGSDFSKISQVKTLILGVYYVWERGIDEEWNDLPSLTTGLDYLIYSDSAFTLIINDVTMTIADSTISHDVFTTVRTLIVNAAPYVTNEKTSATTLASINASYNDKNDGRPQIIINSARVSETGWKFNSTEGKKAINVPVDCYYSGSLGVDQLSDQICTAIKAATISGMELVGITTDYDFAEYNGNKYHFKAIVFTFDRE